MTSLALQTLYQIIIMLTLILVGILCFKKNIINKETNGKLSDLILLLVNPAVIFASYQREFEPTLLSNLFISIVLAVITHGIAIAFSVLLIPHKKDANIAIERFGVVYSNCGYIGIPLANGLFGSVGVFYLAAYMTIFTLLVWTHGVIIMTGKKDKNTFLKALLSPSVIATLVGFILFITGIILPGIILEPISYIANLNTPMAMIVAGVTIAQTNIKKLFSQPRSYYVAFLKLLLVPLSVLLIYQLFPIDREVVLTSVLATACPIGATISLFAIRYDRNYIYASELFAVTTILCVVTIPVVMLVAGFLV